MSRSQLALTDQDWHPSGASGRGGGPVPPAASPEEEIDILELEHDIQDRVRSVVDKQQKEYYLREQLRIIQNELGQEQEGEEELRYAERVDASRTIRRPPVASRF